MDRVVTTSGRIGRLVKPTSRGYVVRFLGVEYQPDVEVPDRDVASIDYDWPTYLTPLEESAAQVYLMRAQSPQEMTPEWWERVVSRFGASARRCMAEAEELLDDSHYDPYNADD